MRLNAFKRLFAAALFISACSA